MYQYHRLPALLKHRRRLLLPSSAAATVAFSTTSRRSYGPRSKAKPSPPDHPADDAAAAAAPGWEAEKLPSELPRPSTIPFQPRVANAVRLVGTVGAPVQLQRLPDGRFSAVSVLVQDRHFDFPKFWIPVIFQDGLAQIAASHLQENDLVYVSGQLTGDVPPCKFIDGQANIQVLANLLSFVDSKAANVDVMVDEDEEEGFKKVDEAEKKVEEKTFNAKYPQGTVSGYRNKVEKWNDVIARPLDWIDNRTDKKSGSKSAKYPDFTNKVSKEGLWLDSAPTAVLEKLDDLVFSSRYTGHRTDRHFGDYKGKVTGPKWTKKSQDTTDVKQKADLWQNLLDNPTNWWDNRSDKISEKHPDFKHKETGQALWIGSQTPRWALDALPTLKSKAATKGARKQETLLS